MSHQLHKSFKAHGLSLSQANLLPPVLQVEPVVTLFTADRVITFPSRTGGNLQLERLHKRPPLPTLQEQGLCMGATFW